MSSSIYRKFAVTNIKKNFKTYVPYIFASILAVMMYFIMHGLTVNEGMGQGTVSMVLGYATTIIVVFAVIFLFYTNSFLIKRRKKEMGIYNILGMTKGNIAKMLIMETVIVAVASIGAGLLLGILFSKLMWWALIQLLNYEVRLEFAVYPSTVVSTLIIFGAIFTMTLFYNLLQMRLSKPVELLHGTNAGEREPKTKMLLALFGAATLGGGYFIALTTESPLAALMSFFVAVLLVVLGTYALFVAGSVVILKALRKNKKFYYKSRHFTSVSGMLYRMKQNAVGLANICILSTMVLILVSTAVSMYIGAEDMLNARFPKEIEIVQSPADEQGRKEIQHIVAEAAKDCGVALEDEALHRCGATAAFVEDGVFRLRERGNYALQNAYELYMIPQEDYKDMTGDTEELKDGEVFLYTTTPEMYGKSEIQVEDKTYHVARELDALWAEGKSDARVVPGMYLVLPDIEEIESWLQFVYEHSNMQEEWKRDICQIRYEYSFNLSGTEEGRTDMAWALRKKFVSEEMEGVRYDSRELERQQFYALYGGLFFIGIYLGMMFLLATVLIIYYKQISEGYDDRERYQIMKKVGMSGREVRRSIKSQVRMVFFLPLLTAIVHVSVAFSVVKKLLAVLGLINVPLFFACTAGTIVVFAVFYGIVFQVTAKEYYKIVNE